MDQPAGWDVTLEAIEKAHKFPVPVALHAFRVLSCPPFQDAGEWIRGLLASACFGRRRNDG